MNAAIVSKAAVSESVLDALAAHLPAILAGVLDVPGGSLARLKPEQVSLEFSQASPRDIGADIRIMVYARRNDPRVVTEHARARTILEQVAALLSASGENYSVNVRLYLMEIGAAENH